MKTTIVILLIIGTLVSVVVVIPQFQGYGIRTLPGRVEYLSEPEPEAVGYVARPPAELGRQLVSPWVSEQSKESVWAETRGRWVLWKGNVHSVEPALNPSRIVLVYEHEAPLPFYTQRFGVVVGFGAQWSESLEQLEEGETVYFRAKLVETEYRLADVYRYGLDLSSQVFLLEEGQIVDPDDIAAKLIDLVYSSYEQVDRLVAVAERVDDVGAYFARRANVSSDLRRQLIAAATRIAGIRLPHDPPISEDDHSGSREASLTEVKREAVLAKSRIEHSLASALTFLHDVDAPADHNHRAGIQTTAGSNSRMVTGNEDFVEEIETLRDEDKRRGEIGIGDLTWFGIGKILGPPASLVISVVNAAAQFGEDLGYRPLYDGMIVLCERQLHIVSATIDTIGDNTTLTIESVTGSK